jgi:hypothetical protein
VNGFEIVSNERTQPQTLEAKKTARIAVVVVESFIVGGVVFVKRLLGNSLLCLLSEYCPFMFGLPSQVFI